ncbi:hypothetical protein HJFPF1_10102 [Paramyrothecium foliicola]|nr:hypothetical protein HJFPF1_10102 [Paramyrothecium foliicola]
MLFTSLLTLTATIGAATAAALAPAPSSLAVAERPLEGVELGILEEGQSAQLDKRATEGVHLVNCDGNGLKYSIIVYCPDDSNCNHQPSSDNQCFMTTSSLYTWEGRTNAGCAFTSGVTFRFTLPANAKTRPLYSAVGSGSNGFRSFTIYNDAQPIMYTAAGLSEDDDEILVEIDPPSFVNGRRVIRTKASQSSEDWANFNIWRDFDKESQLKGTCFAFQPLKFQPTKHTDSNESVEQLRHWIEECNTRHICYKPDQLKMPTRLVQVTDDEVRIVSAIGPFPFQKYATLSHRWGATESLVLSRSTLAAFKVNIPWDTIPRLYRDSIQLIRQLGINYIWIDTLCILQDDPDDWAKEAPCMSTTFGNCYICIAAAQALDSEASLFSDSNLMEELPAYEVPRGSEIYVRSQPYWTHNNYGSNYGLDEDAPVLLQRGWVLQERLLALRVVYYDNEELKWECTEATDCQCGGIVSLTTFKPAYYRSLRNKDVPLPFQWMRVSERYSQLGLTFDKDRAVALSGIAAQASASGLAGKYLTGVWEKDLAHQLCWKILNTHRRIDASIVPSWSWLSVFGAISYMNRMYWDKEGSLVDVQLKEAHGEEVSNTSGFLKLDGRGVEMQSEVLEYGSENEPPLYRLTHQLTGSPLEDSFDVDYVLESREADRITEMLVLYWGKFCWSEHVFMMLRKVPGSETEYKRVGIFWWSDESKQDDLDKLLGWCQPFKDLIIT